MRKTMLGSLTGLLIPFAAYAAPVGYGAYQRKSLSRGASSSILHLPAPSLWRVKSPETTETDDLSISPGITVRELIIVDETVRDKHLIFKQIQPGVDIVEIKSGNDGVASLISALAGHRNLDAVHIVAHAEAGAIYLGGNKIDQQKLMENISGFAAINNAIREGGDLMIYGCDLAQGEAGEDLLRIIQNNTHVDIAASLDKTGNESFGGNWELEIKKGDIEAVPLQDSIALKDFTGTLQFTGTINFSQIKNAGTYGGAASVNAEVWTSASQEYALVIDGRDVSTDIYNGVGSDGDAGFTHVNETQLTLRFLNNEIFSPQSLQIANIHNLAHNFTITSNKGDSLNVNLPNMGVQTVNLSGFSKNITSITISSDKVYGYVDNFQVTSVGAYLNTNPTDVALSANSIGASSTVAGATVGVLSTTDIDVGDTHTYSLVANGASNSGSCGAPGDDHNASFQIDNVNDQLETAGHLNAGTYRVCVQTHDGTGSYQETFTITVTAGSDGTLTAAAGVTEPVGLATTVDTVGEAVNVFDFTLGESATDGLALTSSQVVLNVSGTSTDTERSRITWRLNGPDVSNVTGTYNGTSDTITFSTLGISVADGGNETYTVNAFYNNNTGLTDGRTIIFSVDGDTNLTVGAGGTQMGSTSPVTNGTGTTIDVVATQLVFATQPAGSVSGFALTTQPVVAARDAFGNTDVHFTETVTLTEASAGTLSNNTQAAVSGAATFTNLIYTATADQQSFTLTANDQDGVGSNLPTVDSNSVTSNVVATKLLFTTQPAPTSIIGGVATGFTTVPVVSATDANNIVDTGHATGIVLSVTDPNDGIVDGTVNSMTGTGDTDGSGTTVTLTPSSGVATYTGLQLTYTTSGGNNTIALRATSGGLTAANSSNITAAATPVVTDARISISGATGTGGAYKIGDTVTATWNNTAGGDNNAGVTGVTVDFTQFGGGAAVVASNNSDTWTATYTLVSGAIDATNRNVSVTATNASGDTTTADTTNATVDNIAPIVTDARISISGATGTGGAYKIGDTVTATWNNTAGGDNNSDTIGGVTVNFTQFGGGAAVAATNSSGTWTATYTIVSGAVDSTNRNVSVTATDNAGNATTTADTSNATVDNIAPTVTDANISISGASGTGGVYRTGDTVTATWNNTAGGDNNSDTISSVTVNFTQFGGGAAVAATNSSGTWTATYTIVAGAIDAANRNVSVTATDDAGNGTTAADTTNATVDNQAAAVGSVGLPANGTYVAAQNLDFTVNYGEAVTVNTAGGTPRLTLTVGAATRFVNYLSGSGTTALVFRYTVQAGDKDSDGISLSATLDLNGGTLTDNVGNNAGTNLGAIGSLASVLVDAGGPLVNSVGLPANDTYVAGENLDFTVTFDEAATVSGTPRLVLTIGLTTRHANYQSGSGGTALLFRYTVQAGDNDSNGIALSSTLDLNGGTIRDSVANDASTDLGAIGSLAAVLVDTQAPVVGVNTVLNVGEGETGTVGSARLAATDNISAAANITFTVVTIPVNGDLNLNGGALANGNTFTQDDINNNRVSYEHDGSPTVSDSFVFNVRDAVNNVGGNLTFSFNIAPPEEPAITAPADLDIDATGLYTTVTLRQLLGLAANASDAAVQAARLALASDNADGAGCCNPVALELSNDQIRLSPGAHIITWRATDSDSNTAQDTQNVNVNPLVSLAKDQIGAEGGQVELRIILNGLSPVYPLDVPYTIDTAESSADNTDHDLVDGIATFNSGETEVSVTINLADDAPEGDEVLVVRLDDPGINAGANSSQRITITEGNLAPVVSLNLQQNGIATTLITPADGMVTATAIVNDPNGAGTPTYDWSLSDTVLLDTDGNLADATFVFNPAALSAGTQTLAVRVTDNGGATAGATRHFRVVVQLPVLDTSDSDNDGIDDQTEGTGDADADGIPDYLDNIGASNVLPETAAQTDGYLIECDPGLRCRLGVYSLLGAGGGARLAQSDIAAQSEIDPDDGYEHSGGVFDFAAQGLPIAGQSLRVVIPLQAVIPIGAVYRKFANDQWNTFVEDGNNALHSAPGEAGYCPPPGTAAWQSGLQAGYYCVQLTLEDGGPNDADGAADGSIEDPGSIATLVADEVIEVYGIRSKVKGGGSVDGLFLLALVFLVLLRNRRIGTSTSLAGVLLLLPVQHARAVDWNALLQGSSVELGLYQAKGSHGRGDLIGGLADDGIAADVQTYDVSRLAYQLYLNYRYHEYLAARFGYLDMGDARVDMTANVPSGADLSGAISKNYPVSGDGWVLANRFEYPVYERFSVAVDAGVYRWDARIALSGSDIDPEIQGDTDPIFGIGVNYRVTHQYAAGLNWQRIFFSNQEVDLWGLSGVFRF